MGSRDNTNVSLDLTKVAVTGIVASNTLEYAVEAINQLNQSRLLVNLRSEDDEQRKSLLSVDQVLPVGGSCGWSGLVDYPKSQSEALGQALFSSGTEGTAKVILITCKALSNTTDRLIEAMELTEEVREYIGVPVYYSFGFGRCRAVARVGGQFYIPPQGFNPIEIAGMLSSGEINSLSAVPTLWRILLESRQLFSDCGGKLRWIEIGSQYMSADEKSALKSLFPNAKIIQHYGLTEASRTTFLSIHSAPEAFLGSVGKPSTDVAVRIGPAGEVQIKGPHLASFVLRDGLLTPLADADGWFATTDAGHFQDSWLFFDGRLDDVVNCSGVKISPDMLERDLADLFDVPSSITIGKQTDPLRGEVPVAFVLAATNVEHQSIRQKLSELLAAIGVTLHARDLQVIPVEKFPVTETGKVKRKLLSSLSTAAGGTQQSVVASTFVASKVSLAEQIVTIWQEVLKISPVGVNDSFFDLGGDSLSAISVVMKMEKAGLGADVSRLVFQGLSIAEILKSVGEPVPDSKDQVITGVPSLIVPEDSVLDKGASPLEQKLITIWEETLKISPVSMHDSFFDLGGDSLSAISVTIKMEAAGVPQDVCRKIFQGWSIQQIINQEHAAESDVSPQVVDSSSVGDVLSAKLVEIWEEVLKLSPVGTGDSFFDLGGDSLSAISVSLKMEQAGIPADICRKIFQGHSIQALVADAQGDFVSQGVSVTSQATLNSQSQGQGVAQQPIDSEPSEQSRSNTETTATAAPRKLNRTPLAAASRSLDIVRGLLVLMNVGAHWVHGVLARLPEFVAGFNAYFSVFYSSGTPGFAMVFGAGLGMFLFPRYLRHPQSVRPLVVRNALLLGGGITALALLKILSAWVNSGEIPSAMAVSNAFWNVLTYYFYAVISLPLWFKALSLSKNTVVCCLGASLLFYGVGTILGALEIPPSANPLVQHFVLLVTAKYNYFEMSAGVLLGMAFGVYLKFQVDNKKLPGTIAVVGGFISLLALLVCYHMGDFSQILVWPKGVDLWTWPLYLGAIMMMVWIAYHFMHHVDAHPSVEFISRCLSLVGVMAFPIFIGHEMVIPLKDLLDGLGVPMPLTISMGAFLAFSGYLVYRLYRVYYGFNLKVKVPGQ